MKLKQVDHNRSKARRIIGLKGRPFGKPAQSRLDLMPYWNKERPTGGFVVGSGRVQELLRMGSFSRNPATKNRYTPHQGEREKARRRKQATRRLGLIGSGAES